MQIDHNPISPYLAVSSAAALPPQKDYKKVVAENSAWYTGGLSIFQAIEEGFSPGSVENLQKMLDFQSLDQGF
jgi:hypothetical protein